MEGLFTLVGFLIHISFERNNQIILLFKNKVLLTTGGHVLFLMKY